MDDLRSRVKLMLTANAVPNEFESRVDDASLIIGFQQNNQRRELALAFTSSAQAFDAQRAAQHILSERKKPSRRMHIQSFDVV